MDSQGKPEACRTHSLVLKVEFDSPESLKRLLTYLGPALVNQLKGQTRTLGLINDIDCAGEYQISSS